MRPRAWRGWQDLPLLQAGLAVALRDGEPGASLHPGDLAWWLGWFPKTDAELGDRVAFWEQDDLVVAWVVFDDDEVAAWVAPGPHADAARRSIDAWLEERPPVDRYARTDDAAAIARLADAGYRPVEGKALITFGVDLDEIGPLDLDPRVAAVTPADERDRASVTHAAFGVDRPFEAYAHDYATYMDSPAYPDGWDLLLRSPSGEPAACAIAWPDAISGIGNFEPVATHPRHRRQGFAAGVLHDGMRRLRDAGMRRAIVRTYASNAAGVALYRSAGFADAHVEHAYRRV